MRNDLYYIGRKGSWIQVTREIFTRYMLMMNKVAGGKPMMRIERYRDEPAPHVVIHESGKPMAWRLMGRQTREQAEAVTRQVLGSVI